jgi:protein Tex
VHISELSTRFIKDPNEAIKAGQIVRVQVLSADPKTKRISLSIKALQQSDLPKVKRGSTAPRRPQPPSVALEDRVAKLADRFRTR